MYNPLVEIVPVVPLPPVRLFTCHVTEVSLALVTVAVNRWVPAAASVAEVGEIAIVTAGGVVLPEPPEPLLPPLSPWFEDALPPQPTSTIIRQAINIPENPRARRRDMGEGSLVSSDLQEGRCAAARLCCFTSLEGTCDGAYFTIYLLRTRNKATAIHLIDVTGCDSRVPVCSKVATLSQPT